MLFGAAAIRIPLTQLGLIQYLAPTLQFMIGVLIYSEPMPASRLAGFALVWVALAVFTYDAVRGSAPRRACGDRPATGEHPVAGPGSALAEAPGRG